MVTLIEIDCTIIYCLKCIFLKYSSLKFTTLRTVFSKYCYQIRINNICYLVTSLKKLLAINKCYKFINGNRNENVISNIML